MVNEFSAILQKRVSRRTALQLGAGVSASTMLASAPLYALTKRPMAKNVKSAAFDLTFASVPKAYTKNLTVAQGYQARVLMRWGDKILPIAQDATAAQVQARCFGYNNDFIAYLPISGSSHGILHVNHEYTNAHLMFPNTDTKTSNDTLTDEQLRIEQQAHGFSTLEVRKDNKGQWQTVENSNYARRVTATTPIAISGAAAGSPRMQTTADPSGRLVLGTLGNCSGGVTPWGTVLVAEENIDGYFVNQTIGREAKSHQRYTIARRSYYGWQRIDDRFNVAIEPNEPNRFGWVVEYDPRNPNSQPVKRTALGRFKHETATCATTPDGRVVIYSGDDDYFEYIYRFVSKHKISSGRKDLLDHGTLSVAKFAEDGTLTWLPLIYGKGRLTQANGFTSQADVLIEARRAGDILGATKMDRPEGIAVQPYSQHVCVSLTKNPKRKATNAANPRANNKAGHIVKMIPPAGDHAANEFLWNMHILAGDPDSDNPDYDGRIHKSGWFGNPDNLTFHPNGNLWIATDGMPKAYGVADGLYATNSKVKPKAFLCAPKGAEVTGPCFTPDGETLFVSIQHPGEDKGSSFDNPSTRWPDFKDNRPPRPSIIVVTKV